MISLSHTDQQESRKMEESRAFPLTGNLDPHAQEFVPLSSAFYFPYTPPPPLPPTSYGLPPVFSFFPLPPHPMMFSLPPPPLVPPQPYFSPSSQRRLPLPSNSPTRCLSLMDVPRCVTESIVRRDLEIFGDVRGVEMERISEGVVTVHFYDLLDAKRALRQVCGRHMQHHQHGSSSSEPGCIAGSPVWARFVIPDTTSLPGGRNQGTLVLFNLDPDVPSSHLKHIFHFYGPIKELRETPFKKNQRFIEFYDIRDAAVAFDQMNGAVIGEKQVVIEFSRPGGLMNKFRSSRHPPRPPFHPPPLLEDTNENVSPSHESSMRSLSINDDDDHNKTSATKSKNIAKWGKRRHITSSELSQFLISEDTMEDSSSRDPRTTLMIKNIPNKYSQKLLLDMLDEHCIQVNEAIAKELGEEESHDHQPFSSYDFVYLPMDFNNKCNVGYGFVNMTSPEAAWRLYKAFHKKPWEIFNSHKICQVVYARVQGLKNLKEHFKSSKFPSEGELLPVVLSPPRDGKQLTEPVSINISFCTGLNHSHNIEEVDGKDSSVNGQDNSVNGSCGSDHENSL